MSAAIIAHYAVKFRDNTRCAKTSRDASHIQTRTDGYRKISKVKSFWGQHTNFQMDVKKIPQSIFLKKCDCVVEERLLYMLVPKTSRGQLLPGWALFFRHTLRLHECRILNKYGLYSSLWVKTIMVPRWLQSPRAYSFNQSLSWPYIFVYYKSHLLWWAFLFSLDRWHGWGAPVCVYNNTLPLGLYHVFIGPRNTFSLERMRTPVRHISYGIPQISYAPKALDRSLAAYLRCDLKANVFVYSCNCRAYLWKQLRTYAGFFRVDFHKAHTFERLCEITCCRYCWQVAQKITPQK